MMSMEQAKKLKETVYLYAQVRDLKQTKKKLPSKSFTRIRLVSISVISSFG